MVVLLWVLILSFIHLLIIDLEAIEYFLFIRSSCVL